MSTDYKPAIGDWVTMVLEGEIVEAWDNGGFLLDPAPEDRAIPANAFSPSTSGIKSVEKIPAPIRVGDVVTGAQLAEVGWRRGTCVVDLDFPEDLTPDVYTGEGGTWVDSAGEFQSIDSMIPSNEHGFKVVYIP